MAWGINEWFGKHLETMTADERLTAAGLALKGQSKSNYPLCPFQQVIKPGATCNKNGGVCSIRDMSGVEQKPTTSCPSRFLEQNGNDNIFSFMSKEFFDSSGESAVVKEVPFLAKIDSSGKETGKKAGRIDWVLVPNPTDITTADEWLAIETQAVYFIGGSMETDFQSYLDDPGQIFFPTTNRRPDWRSSGPKRLAPQLSMKSPAIRRWGKKVAVVVDEAFFEQLGPLGSLGTDFENSEVIWVVMAFEKDSTLRVSYVVYTELDTSVQALNASKPVNRAEFQNELWNSIVDDNRNKAFRFNV